MGKLNQRTIKTYKRLLTYVWVYKNQLLLGIVMAFVATIFNAASVTSFMPIIDTISQAPDKPYQLPITKFDRIRIKKLQKGIPLGFIDKFKYQWYLIKKSINKKLAPIKSSELLFYSFWILPVFLLRLIFGLLSVFLIASVGLKAVRDLRGQLFQKIESLPMTYFYTGRTGALMSRMINDAHIVSDSISHDLRVTIYNIFLVFTHLAILLFLHWQFLVISVLLIPLVIYPTTKLSKRIRNASVGEQERTASLNANLEEVISGIRTTRAFAAEKYEQEKYDKINNHLYEQTFKGKLYHATGPALVEMTTSIVFIGMLIYGGYQVQHYEDFTFGAFVTFIFIFLFIMSPIKQLAHMINLVTRASAAGDRIFEILDYPVDIIEKTDARPVTRPIESIVFKNVSFKYPGTEKLVLDNINLKITKGKTIGLAGLSGGGKSTLVDLIPRFFDPTEGSIYLNDYPLTDYRLKELRRSIGFVSQEVFLFHTTVKENVCYGQKEINESEMIEACKKANAHDFIMELPKQYDTVIGEKGVMLSGGQRQRLSIARALMKDPPLLILDEATSNLDTESEKLVQTALENLMQDRTTIIIAHRLSTIFKADEILVIESGKIVQQGNHEKLLKEEGTYKKLYEMQFSV